MDNQEWKSKVDDDQLVCEAILKIAIDQDSGGRLCQKRNAKCRKQAAESKTGE